MHHRYKVKSNYDVNRRGTPCIYVETLYFIDFHNLDEYLHVPYIYTLYVRIVDTFLLGILRIRTK